MTRFAPRLSFVMPMSRHRNPLQPREGGNALVEFALIFPFLVLIIAGIIDLGQGVYAYGVVASAAREGARFAITDPHNDSGIVSQAKANTAALNPSQVNVTKGCFPNSCSAGGWITVTVTYNWQPITLYFSPLTLRGSSVMTIEY